MTAAEYHAAQARAAAGWCSTRWPTSAAASTSCCARAPAARPRSTCSTTTSSTCASPTRPACRRSWSATSTAAACSPPCTAPSPCCPTTSAPACAGFVINKLRGDPALLLDGCEQLAARTGVPDRRRHPVARRRPASTPRTRWPSTAARRVAGRGAGRRARRRRRALPDDLELHRPRSAADRAGRPGALRARPGRPGRPRPRRPAGHARPPSPISAWLRARGLAAAITAGAAPVLGDLRRLPDARSRASTTGRVGRRAGSTASDVLPVDTRFEADKVTAAPGRFGRRARRATATRSTTAGCASRGGEPVRGARRRARCRRRRRPGGPLVRHDAARSVRGRRLPPRRSSAAWPASAASSSSAPAPSFAAAREQAPRRRGRRHGRAPRPGRHRGADRRGRRAGGSRGARP